MTPAVDPSSVDPLIHLGRPALRGTWGAQAARRALRRPRLRSPQANGRSYTLDDFVGTPLGGRSRRTASRVTASGLGEQRHRPGLGIAHSAGSWSVTPVHSAGDRCERPSPRLGVVEFSLLRLSWREAPLVEVLAEFGQAFSAGAPLQRGGPRWPGRGTCWEQASGEGPRHHRHPSTTTSLHSRQRSGVRKSPRGAVAAENDSRGALAVIPEG